MFAVILPLISINISYFVKKNKEMSVTSAAKLIETHPERFSVVITEKVKESEVWIQIHATKIYVYTNILKNLHLFRKI